MRRAFDAALAALFVVMISLPLAGNLAGFDGADPTAENRDLAGFPRFTLGTATFANGLSAWFDDHFAFRARLVRWYGETRLFWLGVSPSSSVVRGRDGWFFYAEDGALEDYTHAPLLDPAGIANWRETIARTKKWCARRGIAYLFTIAPDKTVLYPEKMPDSIRQLEPNSRIDQVLNAVSDIGVGLDLRPALYAARVRERLYQKTDTHWNELGAFAAYQQIIQAVRLQDPSVPPPWPRVEFELAAHDIYGRDLARMMGLGRVLREEDLTLVPQRPRRATVIEPAGESPNAQAGRLVTEIPGSHLPRAVIFRDSFTSALAPFLSEHFSRAVYLWRNDFAADEVLQERPDVVIQEIVGRHLYNYIPSPELIPER